MKLIIDVPDEVYTWLCEQYANSNHDALSISFLDIVCNAVEKGMPYEERPRGECEKM